MNESLNPVQRTFRKTYFGQNYRISEQRRSIPLPKICLLRKKFARLFTVSLMYCSFPMKFAVHMGDENSNPTLCGIICHTYTSKMFLVIKKKFPKILRLLEQFLLTVKGQNNFW